MCIRDRYNIVIKIDNNFTNYFSNNNSKIKCIIIFNFNKNDNTQALYARITNKSGVRM